MIDIKTISGELLLSVPILQDAVCHEELMVSDYVALSWNSDDNDELPAGAYIEFEGERYSLLEPYKPTMVTEGEFKYAPQFHSRVSAWDKQPACVYTYESDGVTVKTREFDWTIVGSPADAMQIIKQAIKNETGEEWNVKIAESLPASIEISSQTSSIKSVLASIADQCQTEYWVEKATNTLHLSKCEFGEEVALEVGSNIGVPSVMMGGNEYYTRYYALGSSRNITQGTAGINGSVNKRLTLDPTAFPHGYKDVKGHFENGVFVSDLKLGEIFSKVVVFDDIYPSSDLEIYDVRARMKYRLDGDGKKIKIGGTDENPVYDQYSIWYFKIKDFSFSSDSLIEGLPLSVHFKSGRLSGQEFELIYHDKAKTENTNGDVGQFNVEVGDYEIKFKESSGVIIPDIAYIIPQSGDKVTLYNIEMPKEYTSSAQQRLLEALDKHIEKEHSDGNTYEFSSNPVAFYESELTLSVGQKVSFVNGEKTLETRTLMVERKLDYPCEQKIRIGSDIIKGSTKELRENVESLNHNVDVLAAFNDLSKSIQDSYGRNQALVNEAISSLLGIWYLDKSGNLVTDKQVLIKNNLIVEQDTSSGGEGQDTPSAGLDEDEVLDIVKGYTYSKSEINKLIDDVNAGDVDLTNYYTKDEVDAKIPSLDGYATEDYVDDAITALNLSQYAKGSDLDALQAEVDNIDAVLGLSETAEGYINTWAEVKAFLDGYKNADDLATILSGINADIAKNAENIATLDNDKADKATTLAGYGITDAYTKSDLESYKTWWDAVMGLVVKEGNNIRIKTNLIIEGDTSSGGSGQDTPASGTVTGIKVSASDTLTPNNAGIIDMVSVLSSIDVSDQLKDYAKLTDITKNMVDSVLGSTTAGNANRFLMSTGSTSVWAAISKDMVTDALGYTPLSTGGGTMTGAIVVGSFTSFGVSGNTFYLGNPSYPVAIRSNGTTTVNGNTLYHSGNFNPADYLPLSGGTMVGGAGIYSHLDSVYGAIGFNADHIAFGSPNVPTKIRSIVTPVYFNGVVEYTLIHSGNIGSQSVEHSVTANRLSSSYSENINYGSYLSELKLIRTNDGNGIANGFPGDYFSGLSVLAGYTGWQMVTYGDWAYPNPHFRSQGGDGSWSPWRQLAFIDSNVASATKLANNSAFYAWGQMFFNNGVPQDANGYMLFNNGDIIHAKDANGSEQYVMGLTSVLSLGYGTSASGIDTYIEGNNVYLRYGTSHATGLTLNSSGNVTIGGSDLAGTDYRLRVEGPTYIRHAATNNGIATALAIGHNVDGQSAKEKGVGITLGYSNNQYHTKIATIYESQNPDYLRPALAFYTMNNTYLAGSEVERMRISANGCVGIGTSSPAYKLDVNGTGNFSVGVKANEVLLGGAGLYKGSYWTSALSDNDMVINGGKISLTGAVTMSSTLSVGGNTTINGIVTLPVNYQIQWGTTGYMIYGTASRIQVDAPLNVSGNTEINGNLVVSGDTSSGSDIRFKDIIKNKTIKIEHIAKAPLFTFKWNDREDDTIHLGSSAQYWEKVTPWLVKGEDFKTLDYSTLGVAMGISLAKKAVNHEERIKVLEKENKALKEEIRRMQYGS